MKDLVIKTPVGNFYGADTFSLWLELPFDWSFDKVRSMFAASPINGIVDLT
jgi:hypothetical protein